jgi:hypothetical protein
MFSEKDAMQLKEKGISRQLLEWQLNVFHKGVPVFKLERVATVGDGIIRFANSDLENFANIYEQASAISVLKFVPASGAATRMFKDLFEYIEVSSKNDSEYTNPYIETFIANLNSFAFSDDLKKHIQERGNSLENLVRDKNYTLILQLLLEKKGLNYGNLPKGLLKFHIYENQTRTPFEEHLVEGAIYASRPGNPIRLHFTVSPEHLNAFKLLLDEKIENLEYRFGNKFEVSFSIQKPSSDTMAVDADNKPFRINDGSILFRPGGHGALIDNLNELDADLIFIKNIDNVIPEKYSLPTIRYKKALAGKLLEIQSKVFKYVTEIGSTPVNKKKTEELLQFIEKELFFKPLNIPDFLNSTDTTEYFKKILDRPMRICGVVKNTGEPGGGPYWAPNGHGDVTLQIVEFSQVDNSDADQVEIFKMATHFNPVDIVCSPRRFDGTKFDLTKFVDKNTCFISQKSKEGKILKALELPGLWNGAMSDWITLFVEVPAETFNPVKTVNDLLRPQHQ